jgi:nitroreductase
MMFRDLVLDNRSYRRFKQEIVIGHNTLLELVDMARLSASARNRQPLKYILSCDSDKNSKIFDCLTWARDLKDWGGPVEGEKPSAYIVILGDKKISTVFDHDAGIAAQSIMLGAVDRGYGGCILASVNRKKLSSSLNIPDIYDIVLVLALGNPAEKVVIESIPADGDTRYWRDKNGVHHVPKRSLKDIVLE